MVHMLFKRNSRKRRAPSNKMIQQYIAASQEVSTRNKERRMANDLNVVSGVDIIGYQITDYVNKHANITLVGGVELASSFVEFLASEEKEAIEIFRATRQASHDSVLPPYLLAYNTEKDRFMLFYERYDSLLESWRGGDKIWWQKTMREQIKGVHYCHEKGFILGHTTTFAMKDNKLKIMNLSSLEDYLQKNPNVNVEELKRENLKSLRDMMRPRYKEMKKLTEYDKRFFNLFDRDDIAYSDLVHKLTSHPYGMNYLEYMWCFQRIFLADERGYLEAKLKLLLKGPKFHEYQNWIDTIQASNAEHLKEALPVDLGQRKGKYKNEDLKTLVTLLRNILEHKHGETEDLTTFVIAEYYKEVCREVQELFPGFLALLLEEVNVHSKYYEIFEFKLV